MSFAVDQVHRIDTELDKIQFASLVSLSSSPEADGSESSASAGAESSVQYPVSPRIKELQALARVLSTASSAKKLLSSQALSSVLTRANLVEPHADDPSRDEPQKAYEQELRWLILGKTTAQAFGLILQSLLAETIPLSNDIWYWNEILSSYRLAGLYSIQTSPIRAWAFGKDVFHDVRRLLPRLLREDGPEGSITGATSSDTEQSPSLSGHWAQFYTLVRESLKQRSVANIQRRVVSPFALSRAEARRKQKILVKFRELSASGLGVLVDEGLKFDFDDEGSIVSKVTGDAASSSSEKEEWKAVVEKSIALMETVLRHVTALEIGVSDFEDTVFTNVQDDSDIVTQTSIVGEQGLSSRDEVLSKKLRQILSIHVPQHRSYSQSIAAEYGRPSKLIRYWLPATVLLLSSSTVLRILLRRKAAIMTWAHEAGQTAVDFWVNWVVGPIKKIIGTIRHDTDSEVAIMSKRSLDGDRESLERMVVDFAVDNPGQSSGGRLSEAEITDIRAKVKEGDLTPVLRAYERDLRKPFMGTVRGDLIRALLIQIQKTKVDVEVAIGGIDALLKSQELVFGFVGLTPGVLVCFALSRWLSGVLGSRKGTDKGKNQGKMVRILRNIDRLLCASTASHSGMLSYKEHGLLLCEVQVLRQCASDVLPKEIQPEFLEELEDLLDIRIGVQPQLKVVERIRWAYGKWIR
ncbi:MAG: Nuclear control of ATPase protein 2 [Sclerophora amabilis]|nr:MAG: Nuclear control of ATPase protein 2 [Sclerophora amabilis]